MKKSKHPLAGKKQPREVVKRRAKALRGLRRSPEICAKFSAIQYAIGHGVTFTSAMDNRLKELYADQQNSIQKTAEMLEVGFRVIRRRLKELGIRIRGHSETKRGKRQDPEFVVRRTKNMKGRIFSGETRNKMSESAMRRLRNNILNVQGFYYSIKAGVKVPYRSFYERNYMEELDNDTLVDHWEYEPESITITYELLGVQKRYRPDFLVSYTDGRQVIVEIKGSRNVLSKQNRKKFEALHSYCGANKEISGYEILVGDDEHDKMPWRISSS